MDEDEEADRAGGGWKMSERLRLCFFMLPNTHLQAISYFSHCREAFAISKSFQRPRILTGTIIPHAPSSIGFS